MPQQFRSSQRRAPAAAGGTSSAPSRPRRRRLSSEPRTMPLGRTALWVSLGLGLGLTVGIVLITSVTGSMPLPGFLGDSPLVRTLGLVWPAALAVLATALLIIGTPPLETIRVPLRAAESLLRTGAPGLARVLAVRSVRAGGRRRLTVVLDLRCADRAPVRTRLVWLLEPVDTAMVTVDAVVPVRVSSSDGLCAALDTRADSRVLSREARLHAGEDVFSPLRNARARLGMIRVPSRWALAAGTLSGVLAAFLD